jgi:hypothetical protein
MKSSVAFLLLFMFCASVGHAQTPASTSERESGFLRRSVPLVSGGEIPEHVCGGGSSERRRGDSERSAARLIEIVDAP